MATDWGGSERERREGELLRLLGGELRKRAERYARAEAPGTVDPTSLIQELYLRFGRPRGFRWESDEHFVAVATRTMRRILLNRAHRRASPKQGGGWGRVTLHDDMLVTRGARLDPLALEEALRKLAVLSPRQCRIAELRLFAGLSAAETAAVLGLSTRLVSGEWAMAQAWLARRLRSDEGASDGGPERVPKGA